ncbi:hypothetical protein [uncultured Cohaesibacter sp.]|uniref:hypothetical protein n=1 Tax=uncultured Cohaesibacter sp. TaxID=1002546 RepID=UPI0029C84E25|nr:hypothetical protein [uncultured Cohaesibacter sp.]
MEPILETIHGYKRASEGDLDALIVDVTIVFGGEPERVPFVYRIGDKGAIADKILEDLEKNSPVIADPDPVIHVELPLNPLTPRQLRLILSRNGYLSQVEPVLDAIPDQQAREEALIEWAYATQYEAGNPLIEQLRAALDIPMESMETMWREAQTL